ncbi:hypothetical protein [Streptomyces sp. NPDC059753]|uniref:hypothetical protein n=1 Tax=Streptomyces sp. NPDC059753 TaxID=3346933 RepID=UPI00365BE928
MERRHGGWVNLLDQAGALADRHQGVVEARESDLASLAWQIIERLGGTWAGCRVVFFAGDRRQNQSLHEGDVFGIVGMGERQLVSGPAHPECGRPTEPNGSGGDSLADGQLVECGACRNEVTVRQVPERTMVLSTPETLRGTALNCQRCGRILCIDCVFPVVDIPVEPQHPQCDRCGGDVGSVGEQSCQITIQGTRRQTAQSVSPPSRPPSRPRQATLEGDRTAPRASYAGLTAAELVDRFVACRMAGRVEDPGIRGILDWLRRDYGHPSSPFAASLERLAFGASGPALFQEGMEPDEVEIIKTVMQRIDGSRWD